MMIDVMIKEDGVFWAKGGYQTRRLLSKVIKIELYKVKLAQ